MPSGCTCFVKYNAEGRCHRTGGFRSRGRRRRRASGKLYVRTISGPLDPSSVVRPRADTGRIQQHFGRPIDAQVSLDSGVVQCHRAEGSQAQPGRHEAERLAEMTGLDQDRTVRARVRIAPPDPRHDGGHQDQRAGFAEPRLASEVRRRECGCGASSTEMEPPCSRRIVIEARRHAAHAPRQHVRFDGMAGASGRRGLEDDRDALSKAPHLASE
jgi:hypothetical protein